MDWLINRDRRGGIHGLSCGQAQSRLGFALGYRELALRPGQTRYVDQIHLALTLLNGIDAHGAGIRAPARVQVVTIGFAEVRIGLETADIVALVVVSIVEKQQTFVTDIVRISIRQQPTAI